MANSAVDDIVALLQRKERRLLKLYFPRDDGPEAALLINRLEADEALG